MSAIRPIFACFLMALLLVGCDRMKPTPKPVSSVTGANEAGRSEALPPSALPPSDASIKPTDPTMQTGAVPSSTSQANPKDLSKLEESASMPLPGQVNNHSTPEPLKQQ
jgi:hypothetical protein